MIRYDTGLAVHLLRQPGLPAWGWSECQVECIHQDRSLPFPSRHPASPSLWSVEALGAAGLCYWGSGMGQGCIAAALGAPPHLVGECFAVGAAGGASVVRGTYSVVVGPVAGVAVERPRPCLCELPSRQYSCKTTQSPYQP